MMISGVWVTIRFMGDALFATRDWQLSIKTVTDDLLLPFIGGELSK